MKRAAAGSLFGLAILPAALAGGLVYHSPNQFTFKLAPGWTRMPDATLQEIEQARAKAGHAPVACEAVFGPKGADGLPHVSVSYRPGRVGELDEVAKDIQAQLEPAKRKAAVRDVYADPIRLDREKHRLILGASMTQPEVGKIRTYCVVQVGREGLAQLVFFSREEDFDKHFVDFRYMASTIEFTEGLRYVRPNPYSYENLIGLFGLIAFVSWFAGRLKARPFAKRRKGAPPLPWDSGPPLVDSGPELGDPDPTRPGTDA